MFAEDYNATNLASLGYNNIVSIKQMLAAMAKSFSNPALDPGPITAEANVQLLSALSAFDSMAGTGALSINEKIAYLVQTYNSAQKAYGSSGLLQPPTIADYWKGYTAQPQVPGATQIGVPSLPGQSLNPLQINPYGTPPPQTGISTSTILLLGGLVLGAVLISRM